MTKTQKRRKKNAYPEGWDKKRVQAVLDHYENQSEEEAVREAEAALKGPSTTVMTIPRRLVPIVRQLIALEKTS